jgi:hypothetical protein
MPFWNIRRGTQPEHTVGSAARDVAPVLEPIQIFTAQRHLEGWIVAGGERVTDLLNQNDTLRVCVDLASDEWASIPREDVLCVAPPERPTHSQRRVHRQKHLVRALVGPYVVSGTAHLQPGSTLDPYLLRTRQQFLPMTNAMLMHRTDPKIDQQLPVVIINVANLTELRALMTVA